MSEKSNFQARLTGLKKQMRSQAVDALVITNNLDQYYLTDFFFYPEETVLLICPKEVFCFTRDLYVTALNKERPQLKVVGCENRLEAAIEKIKELGIKKAGFDAAKETYRQGSLMQKAGLKELPSLVSQLRCTKDSQEIKRMRASNRIAYLAYEYVRPRIKTGMTENDVAVMLEQFMRGQGASAVSFMTIIGFGENAANPHHETGMRKLKNNEAILMDYGCIYQGYCSDITRCWWHGKNEPAEYTRVWNIVDKARRAGIKALKPGVATRTVDQTARGVIEAAGYGAYFTHRTGHGVGMEIHEEPFNSADSKAILRVGNVVTVEPGIYLPGKFGVRLEDTLAITEKGSTILTRK